ncbi:hypothetical protein Pmani_019031 [Petrolisthes manimaculis]|uniref:ADP-ribosylation factor-like protein 2-binding protein n=1 Tax=Petrolisthes manimaculis TaxID=1843537 RepID=A0AAE1U641_9EUCA|nr:hypothetical protein Pmani_019031 [Petrolisthes manimaculis]
MAGLEEKEEVLAEDDSQETFHINFLVGHIENIILSEEFASLRENFLAQHCHIFDDAEENKLEYMDIYKQYTDLIEGHIEKELTTREKGFQMSAFVHELTKSHTLDGEVFDLLLTFTDFLAFKANMLEIKRSQEDNSDTLTDLLQITSFKS